jgi:hypothetical protein
MSVANGRQRPRSLVDFHVSRPERLAPPRLRPCQAPGIAHESHETSQKSSSNCLSLPVPMQELRLCEICDRRQLCLGPTLSSLLRGPNGREEGISCHSELFGASPPHSAAIHGQRFRAAFTSDKQYSRKQIGRTGKRRQCRPAAWSSAVEGRPAVCDCALRRSKLTQSRSGVSGHCEFKCNRSAPALGAHNSGRRPVGGVRSDETAYSARTIKGGRELELLEHGFAISRSEAVDSTPRPSLQEDQTLLRRTPDTRYLRWLENGSTRVV